MDVLATTMLVVLMVAGCVDNAVCSDVDVSVAGDSVAAPAFVVSAETTSDDGGPVVPVSKDPIYKQLSPIKPYLSF